MENEPIYQERIAALRPSKTYPLLVKIVIGTGTIIKGGRYGKLVQLHDEGMIKMQLTSTLTRLRYARIPPLSMFAADVPGTPGFSVSTISNPPHFIFLVPEIFAPLFIVIPDVSEKARLNPDSSTSR